MANDIEEHAGESTTAGPLVSLDAWMAANPWHPRLLPYLVYVVGLLPIGAAQHAWPYTAPALHAMQIGVVAWLLWRYRRLLPELTLNFHWLVLPIGVALCAAWIGLGHAMVWAAPAWFGAGDEPHVLERMPRGLRNVSLGMQLMGMTLVVPLFEELFIRSACLRGLHAPRKTWIGLMQIVQDLPLIGEPMMETRYGRRIARYPMMLTRQLREWPVGKLTLFGVCASTLVFTLAHAMRDWPGAVVCGVAWCGLLWWANRDRHGQRRLGLGPVVWSHGITNALLWGWCVWTGDWQFL